MKGFKISILVFLVTSLSITGVSFLDNKIWTFIISVICSISYFIVGVFYSLKLLRSSNDGSKLFLIVFIILLLIMYWFYSKIIEIQTWINSWPLILKIVTPIMITLLIGLVILWIVYKKDEIENY